MNFTVAFHNKSICSWFRFWRLDCYKVQNICKKMQNKVTISSFICWCYHKESCRQDCNCVSGKMPPLHGSKTEQTRENTPGSITSSSDVEGCLSIEYLLYLYWDNLSLSHSWWCAKLWECNFYGNYYLFSFNLPFVF